LSEDEISNELSNIGGQEEYFSHRLHLNTHAVQSVSVYHFPPSRSGLRTDRHHATFKGRSYKTIIVALVFSVPAVPDSDAIQTIDSCKKLSREAWSALTSSSIHRHRAIVNAYFLEFIRMNCSRLMLSVCR